MLLSSKLWLKKSFTATKDASLPAAQEPVQPTIFHVTHWKAGSQWINKILIACQPDQIVPPLMENGEWNNQFFRRPLAPGKVYPTVYVTREEFDSVQLPPWWKRFVVIRDLRDTLISGYFSLKKSHAESHPLVNHWRELLAPLPLEDGLIRLMTDGWLDLNARIQESWLQAGEPLIRYEAMLENDVPILTRVLLKDCQLAISAERLRTVVLANRFEQLTAGRKRGQEDDGAHERKGVAGDWRTHFSAPVKQVFKERYGRLLIASGYERNLDW